MRLDRRQRRFRLIDQDEQLSQWRAVYRLVACADPLTDITHEERGCGSATLHGKNLRLVGEQPGFVRWGGWAFLPPPARRLPVGVWGVFVSGHAMSEGGQRCLRFHASEEVMGPAR